MSSHDPPPPGWTADVVLRDGHTVHVRPIRPDDADALVRFHRRQSPESVYFRFFSPRPRLTDKEVRHFTTVDHHDRVAFVGELAGDLIAVARYERYSGTDTAEVAFFVDDAHQGRGLGMVLLEFLAAAGRERGLRRFTASALAHNRRMLALFATAGYEVTSHLDAGVVEVAFDLDTTDDVVAAIETRERRAEAASVRRLLAPRSVVVLDAGGTPSGAGHALVRSVRAHGFTGVVHHLDVAGDDDPLSRVVAGLDAITGEPDLVVVASPEDLAPDLVAAAADRGAGAALVLTGGAGPAGALVAAARDRGLRVLGPGAAGVLSTDPAVRLHALAGVATPPPEGPLGVVVADGDLAGPVVAEWCRSGVGVSDVVAGGVGPDVALADLLSYWAEDERTAGVLAQVRTSDLDVRFVRAARAASVTAPVVVLHVPDGLTDLEGDRSAVDRMVEAVIRQTGAVRVPSLRAWFDTARVLAAGAAPAGRGVAVVADSPGVAALAVEVCAAAGLIVRGADGARHGGSPAAPAGEVVTGADPPDELGAAVDRAASTPGVDAVVVVRLGHPAEPDATRRDEALAAAAARHPDTAVLAVLPGSGGRPPLVDASSGTAVPVLEFAESAAEVLAGLASWARWRTVAGARVAERPVATDPSAARAVVEEALARRADGVSTVALEVGAQDRLLDAYGVRVAPRREVRTADGAVAAAGEVGWPVALKAPVRDRRKRSVASGVVLDLASPEELVAVWERMDGALGADLVPAVVQRVVGEGVDVAVRVRRFRDGGGTIEVGLGGPSTGADPMALAVLPLSLAEASTLVAGSGVGRVLTDPLDRVPVVTLVHRLAALAEEVEGIRRVEVNPVVCSGPDAWVADAEVVVGDAADELPVRRLT